MHQYRSSTARAPSPPMHAPPAVDGPAIPGEFEAAHASPDHVELGGSHAVTVQVADGDMELTTGDLNALADYVGSVGELAGLTRAEVEEALVLIRKEPLSPAESERIQELFPRYKELSLANENHFGPSDPALCAPSGAGGPTNRSEITRFFTAACAKAAAGAGDPDALDEALAEAAFGGHFIADAYSSGHLFHKEDMMAKARAAIGAVGLVGMQPLLASAAGRIAVEGADKLERWRLWHPKRYVKVGRAELLVLLEAVLVTQPEVFLNGLALAVHDELSATGVRVTDGVTEWDMYGDHALDPVSAAKASEKIEEGYALVYRSFHTGEAQDASVLLGGLPEPVEAEQDRIRALIDRACDVEGGGMEDAVVTSSVSMLDDILAGAREQSHLPFLLLRIGEAPPGEDAHRLAPMLSPVTAAPQLGAGEEGDAAPAEEPTSFSDAVGGLLAVPDFGQWPEEEVN